MLAEQFSRFGVPVVCADVKGDLSGIAEPGVPKPKIEQRAAELGVTDFAYAAAPVIFWDLYGEQGHPIRATVAEMGPLLLARMLELNETQEGVLNIAFKLADDQGLLLLDFKDLTAILQAVAESADQLTTTYGNVSKATIGTIQRRLLTLEQQGAEHFFGEPALELSDLMLMTADGRGAVNVLVADKLIHSPRLYATFLLWLLSELFEELPEAGDLDKPKLVFFFDEAHLLFNDAPKALTEKVEQVVRLIHAEVICAELGQPLQHCVDLELPCHERGQRVIMIAFFLIVHLRSWLHRLSSSALAVPVPMLASGAAASPFFDPAPWGAPERARGIRRRRWRRCGDVSAPMTSANGARRRSNPRNRRRHHGAGCKALHPPQGP